MGISLIVTGPVFWHKAVLEPVIVLREKETAFVSLLTKAVITCDPNRTCSEPPSIEIEQYLAMLRFENRSKLAELPKYLMEVHNDFTSSS